LGRLRERLAALALRPAAVPARFALPPNIDAEYGANAIGPRTSMDEVY